LKYGELNEDKLKGKSTAEKMQQLDDEITTLKDENMELRVQNKELSAHNRLLLERLDPSKKGALQLQKFLKDAAFVKAIEEWLPDRRFTKIYKASNGKKQPLRQNRSNGFDAKQFHKFCDNRGPTLCLLYSYTSSFPHIFGGYAPEPWSSNNTTSSHVDTFIFTLSNPHGLPPTRYFLFPGKVAQYNYIGYGCSFGQWDIWVASNSDEHNKSYSNFPASFVDTTGFGEKTFTGDKYFQFGEIVVFSVSGSDNEK